MHHWHLVQWKGGGRERGTQDWAEHHHHRRRCQRRGLSCWRHEGRRRLERLGPCLMMTMLLLERLERCRLVLGQVIAVLLLAKKMALLLQEAACGCCCCCCCCSLGTSPPPLPPWPRLTQVPRTGLRLLLPLLPHPPAHVAAPPPASPAPAALPDRLDVSSLLLALLLGPVVVVGEEEEGSEKPVPYQPLLPQCHYHRPPCSFCSVYVC